MNELTQEQKGAILKKALEEVEDDPRWEPMREWSRQHARALKELWKKEAAIMRGEQMMGREPPYRDESDLSKIEWPQVCSICGHEAATEAELCKHLRF